MRSSAFLAITILVVSLFNNCNKNQNAEFNPYEEILIEFFITDENGAPVPEVEIEITNQYWDWDGNAAFNTIKWMKTNQDGYAKTQIRRDELIRLNNEARIEYSRRFTLSSNYFKIPKDTLKYDDKSLSSIQIQKVIKPSAYLRVTKSDDSNISYTNMYNPLIECKITQNNDSIRKSEYHLQDDTIIERLIVIPDIPLVVESIVREPYYPRTVFFSKIDTLILEDSNHHSITIFY